MAPRTMGVAEFETHCLRVIQEVEQSTEPVTITKRGRPIVELNAVRKPKRGFAFGALKGSVLHFEGPFSPA